MIQQEIILEQVVNKGGRPRKALQYEDERNEMLKKLYKIVGVTETNKSIYLYDLDNNKDTQTKILDLKDDIRKYYNCGGWAVFCKADVKRPYMSLIRTLLKDMKIKFFNVRRHIIRNNTRVATSGLEIV